MPQPKDDDFIILIEDGVRALPADQTASLCWKVIVVDDDREVHAATRFALDGAVILGRALKLISCCSAAEAKAELKANPDAAVILLDVVIEEHDAGLRFVQWVRAEGFVSQRIILRTGQPGYAPEMDVIRTYDINGYSAKSELTHTRLLTMMTSAIRSFQQIEDIEQSRLGLTAIVSSFNTLQKERDLARFADGVLRQLACLLRARQEGLICAGRRSCPINEMQVVAGIGGAASYIGRRISELPDEPFPNSVRAYGSELIAPTANAPRLPWVMFSVEVRPDRRYLVCLDHDAPLRPVEAALLRVFATNVAAGFENVALIESLGARTVDLERFAFAAAHDLQEPLRRIAMQADAVAVQAVGIDGANLDRLRAVHASAVHMRKLVGRLLEYVTSHGADFEPDDVPLGAVVAEVEERLHEELVAAGAAVEAGALPWVRADAGSLARVLTLLVENSIAYRGAQPLRISITAETAGEDVTLIVADNGGGFDPGLSDNIFEAFKRLHSQSEVPGSGLGLSIAKRIVEHLGGRMRADAEPGRGARFFIQLPRARSVLQQEADQERELGLQALLALARTSAAETRQKAALADPTHVEDSTRDRLRTQASRQLGQAQSAGGGAADKA